MEFQVNFAGEGGKIAIHFSDYERSIYDNDDDANWLRSSIHVEADPFSGTFPVALTTHEVLVLYERLKKAYDSLSGTVAFETTEEDLALEIKFLSSGAAIVSGIAKPHKSSMGALHFRFGSDQSAIGDSILQLGLVLRRLPVRQIS